MYKDETPGALHQAPPPQSNPMIFKSFSGVFIYILNQ